jgi:hypothetical protein
MRLSDCARRPEPQYRDRVFGAASMHVPIRTKRRISAAPREAMGNAAKRREIVRTLLSWRFREARSIRAGWRQYEA